MLTNRLFYSFVAAEVLLAAALILPDIGRNSFWLDELMTILFASDIANFMKHTASSDPNMWLYYILTSVWLKLGNSEAWVRMLPALFALASIPTIVACGSRLLSRKAGLIAGFLLAIHPFFLAYAREARSYAVVMFFSLLATYTFTKLVHAKGQGVRPGIAYAAVLILGVYNHFYSALHAFGHALSLVCVPFRAWPWKGLFTTVLLVLAGVAAMIIFVGPHETGIITWMSAPHWTTLVRASRQLLGSSDALICFYAANIAAAFLFGIFARGSRWLWIYLLLSTVFPVIFSYVFAQHVMPIFQTRFLAFVVPALALLAGCVLHRVRSRFVVGLVILAAAVASFGPVNNQLAIPSKENWRGLTDHVRQSGQEGDVLICHAPYLITPVRMYEKMRGELPVQLFDLFQVEEYSHGAQQAPRESTIDRLAEKHNRLWLVMGHNYFSHLGSDEQTALLMKRLEKHYIVTDVWEFESIKLFLWSKQTVRE